MRSSSPDLVTAVVFGLLQGATEFLPVSSSGHLAAFAMLFQVREMSLTLIILLHAGTLLATLAVFRAELTRLAICSVRAISKPGDRMARQEGKLLAALAASTAFTVLVALPMEKAVESWVKVPWIVGLGFLGSAAAVLSTRRQSGQKEVLGIGPACLVGLAQGIAAIPGLSRSGVTIACAMALGMTPKAAFNYSFLLSIPVVAGATALKLGKPGAIEDLGAAAWMASTAALVSGYLALIGLREVVSGGRLWWFAWYLLPIGAGLILLDVLGMV